MAKFQKVGDEQKLSRGPLNADPHQFSGGKYNTVGDKVAMSDKPVPLQEKANHTQRGTYQLVGDRVSLSDTPHKGWASYSTPVSDRTIFQSKMPGGKGK